MAHRPEVSCCRARFSRTGRHHRGAAAQQPGAGAATTSVAGGGLASRNFTGKIEVGDTENMNMSRIRFEAGARTNWHLHSAGQLLLVEEGKGRLQEQGSASRHPGRSARADQAERPALAWRGAGPGRGSVQRVQRHAGMEGRGHRRRVSGEEAIAGQRSKVSQGHVRPAMAMTLSGSVLTVLVGRRGCAFAPARGQGPPPDTNSATAAPPLPEVTSQIC